MAVARAQNRAPCAADWLAAAVALVYQVGPYLLPICISNSLPQEKSEQSLTIVHNGVAMISSALARWLLWALRCLPARRPCFHDSALSNTLGVVGCLQRAFCAGWKALCKGLGRVGRIRRSARPAGCNQGGRWWGLRHP